MAIVPVEVVEAVADDIASTARRSDAVLYRGGLTGPAALGILELAGCRGRRGRRRARPHRATTRPTA